MVPLESGGVGHRSGTTERETRVMNRVATGIPGLDTILKGGFIEKRTYLILGSPGVGKTILSLQYLLEGISNGERCLCINMIEPSSTMISNGESFGWDLSEIDMVDLTRAGLQTHGSYEVFSPAEVENSSIFSAVYDAIDQYKPQRLVIDSVTQMSHVSADHYQFRRQILCLMLKLSEMGCTTLMTHEPNALAQDMYTGLAVDGILMLRRELSQQKLVEVRSVEVQKFRGSDYAAGVHYFRFGDEGIKLFPSGRSSRRVEQMSSEQLVFGIDRLDALLGGGLEIGTTTLTSGPTGVGKSTLVAQFLTEVALKQSKKCLYLSFEEAPSSIIKRNEGIGIPLKECVDKGIVRLEYVHPRQYYPDELAMMTFEHLDEGVEVVALDGIRGYEFAMQPYGNPLNSLNNLLAELGRRGVTVVLTNEVEVIAGGELKATETGASHMCDNLILMRYSEFEAEVIKLIGCLKKRLSPFEPELRQLRIEPGPVGLKLGPKLQNLSGILTGVPTMAQSEQ